MWNRYQKLKELLLPLGTGRRRVYDLISRFFRVLFTEGPRGIWVRIRNRIVRLSVLVQNKKRHLSAAYTVMLQTESGGKFPEYIPLSEEAFSGNALVRLIAFYLPQFHPIPENDEWWGKGFTEWTNVSKAVPQFVGHHQPHLPGELGFYDLRIPEVQRRQVELARQYGIHGFCFYYYWFHGKRLLERPLNQFLNDPEIDFPFCICWANENWTRRWDGRENEILIGQEHSIEGDMEFIRDVIPILKHKNYICINGRPVLIVYRANILPDPVGTVRRWKDYCQSVGLKEPYLLAAQTHFFFDAVKIGFDAAVQFPPHSKTQVDIKHKLKILNPNYKGHVVNYADAWPTFGDSSSTQNYRVFQTVFPGWDNEPRKPGNGYTFAFSTPSEYQKWLQCSINTALKNDDPDERIVFINAWNEWAEGAHLEPDRRFGYAYLQATLDALKSAQNMDNSRKG
jgi:lipopolysaccharide biosynthesis protein